jgi:hypothetical protein
VPAIPESALLLAGFLLAHSAWSISDTPDLLVPLAILERSGKRELLRFEAPSQEEAIARGKAKMAALGDDVDFWAFAREGLLNEKGTKIDVLSLDIGGKGFKTRVTIVQRFEPFARRKHFRLLADPEIAIDEVVQDPGKVKDMLEIIRRGIAQHAKVAPLWDGWRRP